MMNNAFRSALTGRRPTAAVVVVIALLAGACASPTATPLGSSPTPSSSPVAVTSTTPKSSPSTSTASPSPVNGAFTLGHFPAVPTGSLPDTTTRALQAALDSAIDQGLPGITATVLVAGRGVSSGAAGTADGVNPVAVRSQFAIASITKTVIAAEVMWLSEQGKLRLSDRAADHLPAGFHFDTNGVTIEDLLSMQSGIPDPIPEDSVGRSRGLGVPRRPEACLAPPTVKARNPPPHRHWLDRRRLGAPHAVSPFESSIVSERVLARRAGPKRRPANCAAYARYSTLVPQRLGRTTS